MLNDRIKEKNIVITGASTGLGERVAYLCAQNGANLYLLARSEEKLQGIAEKIRKDFQVQCHYMKLDISDHDKIHEVFQNILNEMGDIDILVNNAGYGVFEEARNVKMEDLKGMFAVNAVGLIACTTQVIPYMCKRRSGHIMNIASQAGKLATPQSSVYSATKHAVLGYTNSLRMEMAQYNVFVTAVNPGPVRTDFFHIADPTGSYLQNLGRFILDPQKVASHIVKHMWANKREINLPRWMNMSGTLHTIMPGVVERIGRKAFFKK